jgi:hypothetical protein
MNCIISQTNFFQAPVEPSYQSSSRFLNVDAGTYVTECVTSYHVTVMTFLMKFCQRLAFNLDGSHSHRLLAYRPSSS